VANNVLNYEAAVKGLFPKGKAFSFKKGKGLTSIVKAMALSFWRVDNRAYELVKEMNPLHALELLPEWEAALGLPDDCSPSENITVQERRFQVVSKLSIEGGHSRAFYIHLIKQLGFEIEIAEHRPFTCESYCDDDLTNSKDWLFTWDVILREAVIYYFNCESSCDESLRVFRNDLVQCFINKMKPSHTFVRFIFLGE
jgi:uncharacterized protein YmfQ (DUF2313 family)